MPRKSKFSIARKDQEMLDLVSRADHGTLAIWAIDCAERVMHHFEKRFPGDQRPRTAIETLRSWMATGVFRMAVIRKASLDAHAAARETGEDGPARSAARAAGQAVATAHVPRHSYGSAIYAQQAVHRAATPLYADEAAARERKWQLAQLGKLLDQAASIRPQGLDGPEL